MKLLIVCGEEANDIKSVEVEPSMDLDDLKALLEVETGILVASQLLSFHGTPLMDGSKKLLQYGLQDNDVVILVNQKQSPKKENYLARSKESSNKISSIYPGHAQEVLDPFNPEVQKQIEEAIRQQNILSNYEAALEHNPESFGKVWMLYINCTVNNQSIKAFVDSGAQATIMSKKCAERCGLMRLIDTRFQGIAQGVGTAAMIGRIHAAQVKMGYSNLVVVCSFLVMEMDFMDVLIGLDMLKKHQAIIDLRRDVLQIFDESIPFLSESECPKHPIESVLESSSSSQSSKKIPVSTSSMISSNRRPSVESKKEESQKIKISESDIETLLKIVPYGSVTREQVVNALKLSDGNIELAASILMGL